MPSLLAGLPGVLDRAEAGFSRFFVDATDTWFEGHGPPLAAPGKDKSGAWRRRVGIVLLCDGFGRPVRWHTLDGRFHDGTALLDMVAEASRLPWIGAHPIVLDRAVGGAGSIERLVASNVRFLTALPRQEFASSGAPVPWDAIGALQAVAGPRVAPPEHVAARAEALGFSAASADRCVRDLGIFEKSRPSATSRVSRAILALRATRYVTDHPRDKPAALMQALGCSHSALRRYRGLAALLPELQERVMTGAADGLSLERLGAIARRDASEQKAAFESAIAEDDARRPLYAQQRVKGAVLPGWPLRGVLSFSVLRFREQSERLEAGMASVDEEVARINRRLATHPRHQTDGKILGAIAGKVKKLGLGDLYAFRIESPRPDHEGRRLVALLDEAALRRPRATAGLALIVAHPTIQGTAAEIAAMYASKDAIEKGFQTIKSVLDLHPVRHRTDEKLRAHVALCMLALVVERSLHRRLASTPDAPSVPEALAELATLHLNRVVHGDQTLHTLTAPTPRQRQILAALNMQDLVASAAVAARISPR